MRSSSRFPTRSPLRTWWLALSAAAICALLLVGCSLGGGSTTGAGGGSTTGGGGGSTTGGGGGGGGGGGAPTATPIPPPHALAWFQVDGSGVGQIWASVNGGSAHQVTHMPPMSGDCVRDQHWSPPVFSPDMSHIVGGWGSGACGDGPEQGDLYTVNASSGAATTAGGSCFHNIRLSLRQTGWVNNSTIWWIDGQHVYTQPLGGACATLGTIASSSGSSYAFAEDAVLRGNTLFFEVASGSSGSTTTSYALRRFDMTTHAALGGSISLGSGNPCICSRNDAGSPGFDVSADGAHMVYQKATPVASGGDQEGVASSKFYYANADGSSATQIAACGTAKSFVRMQISPNGHFIAVARALPAPSVFTASVTSGGACADPAMKFYSANASSYPVWKWDNTTFWASTSEIAEVYPPTTGNVEHFDFGVAAGSVGVAGGANPWYTIGA